MPFLSVIIPVYNAAPFLHEVLDSLSSQTFRDFEAIAVNDGSTDDSLEILRDYAARDSRIRILDGPNGGYGKAMNRGMDAATGKYMAILEPDDYLPCEAYDILSGLAEAHQLDVVRGTHCTFYEEDGQSRFHYVIPLRRPGEVFCPRQELPGVFEFGPHIWTGLYRIAFLKEHGIRFHESPGASYQDTGFFFLCAAYADRYMLTDEVTYLYRTNNPNSSVNNVGRKRYALMEEYAHIRRCLEEKPALWKLLRQQYHTNRVCGIIWVASLLAEDEAVDFVREMSRQTEADDMKLVPEHYREALEACRFATASGAGVGEKKSCCRVRTLAGGAVRISMSASQTDCYLFGIPLIQRRRLPLVRHFRSGIEAESDMVNEWRVLGIRVRRAPVPRYAAWTETPVVPARFPGISCP